VNFSDFIELDLAAPQAGLPTVKEGCGHHIVNSWTYDEFVPHLSDWSGRTDRTYLYDVYQCEACGDFLKPANKYTREGYPNPNWLSGSYRGVRRRHH
jgi:hypothetical protein